MVVWLLADTRLTNPDTSGATAAVHRKPNVKINHAFLLSLFGITGLYGWHQFFRILRGYRKIGLGIGVDGIAGRDGPIHGIYRP
jgi:hypothetical protein